MNKILLVGRLVKDPEQRIIEDSQKALTKIIIAVNRDYKEPDGERKADFIPVSFWGKKGDIILKHLHKGDLISVGGRLRMGSYVDKDGNKKYISDVVAEDFKFVRNQFKMPEIKVQ